MIFGRRHCFNYITLLVEKMLSCIVWEIKRAGLILFATVGSRSGQKPKAMPTWNLNKTADKFKELMLTDIIDYQNRCVDTSVVHQLTERRMSYNKPERELGANGEREKADNIISCIQHGRHLNKEFRGAQSSVNANLITHKTQWKHWSCN